MSIYKSLLDEFEWSYSRLTSYEYCPYGWYKHYIEQADGEGSFYADNGSIIHEIFDGIIKGKISIENAPSVYLDKFNNITNKVKSDLMNRTFDACINYLCLIPNDVLNDYDIVASELKINFQIDRYKFVGFIDLLLKDKDGEFIIVDHKSAEPFLKKDGKPYAKSKDTFANYVKQLSLYAIGIKNMFGKYPKKLVFHHFKNEGKTTIVTFDETVLEEAVSWAKEVINKIYNDEEFLPQTKTGYCYRLCGYRNNCEYMTGDDDEEV